MPVQPWATLPSRLQLFHVGKNFLIKGEQDMSHSAPCFQETGPSAPPRLLTGHDGDKQSDLGSHILKITETWSGQVFE